MQSRPLPDAPTFPTQHAVGAAATERGEPRPGKVVKILPGILLQFLLDGKASTNRKGAFILDEPDLI